MAPRLAAPSGGHLPVGDAVTGNLLGDGDGDLRARSSGANGATATVTIVITTPTAEGPITNTASVSSNESDPNAANNGASVTTTVTTLPPPSTAPAVSACDPNNGNRNQQLTVQVTGSNFQNGATASFGDRVTVQSPTFVSATQLSVRVKVIPQASSGTCTVTTTNADGQSGSLPRCFTVN